MAPKPSCYAVRPRKEAEEQAARRAAMIFDDGLQEGIYDALVRGEVPTNPRMRAEAQPATGLPVSASSKATETASPALRVRVPPRLGDVATAAPSGGGAAASKAPPASSSSSSSSVAADDAQLLTVMTQRLRTLESQVSVLQKELKQKSMRLIDAEDRAQSLKHDLKCANEEKAILADKLEKIHKFLADYGLTWVGDEEPQGGRADVGDEKNKDPPRPIDIYAGSFNPRATVPAGSAGEEPMNPHLAHPDPGRFAPPGAAAAGTRKLSGHDPNAAASSSEGTASLPFDLALLLLKAESLTASIGFSGVEVSNDRTHAAIRERTVVKVCVYQNGISVNRGPFRPYGWPLCDAFLSDILDGYFPYEFKDKYPDGFPIEVIDKSTEMCPTEPAAPKGIRSMADKDAADSGAHEPLTREEVLRRLPTQVITAGGVIVNPREGLAKLMGVQEQPPAGGGDLVLPPIPTRAGEMVKSDPGSDKITRIQVRLPAGGRALLHLFFDETVGDLLQALRNHLPETALDKNRPVEISTVFPRRSYTELATTMQEAGLVPNCLVHVRYIST